MKHAPDSATRQRRIVAACDSARNRAELVGGGKRTSAIKQADSDEETTFDPRVLGSSDFVEKLRQDRQLSCRLERELSIAEVVRRVAKQYNVPVEYLRQPRQSRTVSEARSLVCYSAVRQLKHTGAAVARYLNVSRSAVSMSSQKGEHIFAESYN